MIDRGSGGLLLSNAGGLLLALLLSGRSGCCHCNSGRRCLVLGKVVNALIDSGRHSTLHQRHSHRTAVWVAVCRMRNEWLPAAHCCLL